MTVLSRRLFLGATCGALASAVAAPAAFAEPDQVSGFARKMAAPAVIKKSGKSLFFECRKVPEYSGWVSLNDHKAFDRSMVEWLKISRDIPEMNRDLHHIISDTASLIGAEKVLVNSGWRTLAHQLHTKGGAKNSYHPRRMAADLNFFNSQGKLISHRTVWKAAKTLEAGGCGLYSWGVHLDCRGHLQSWTA